MDQNSYRSKSKKKQRLIILCSIIVVIALLVSAIFSRYNIFTGDVGVVTGISTKMINKDAVELSIRYQYPCGGYSVRIVPEDEGEYISDGIIDYDGSLGKYRMMVEFGDVELSTTLVLKFVAGETVRIKNQPVKIRAKVAYPSDHGFVLYLGFDQPISLESLDAGELYSLGGTIKIPIIIEDQ